MPDVRVRPFLGGGLVYLALGLAWALAEAFGPGTPAPTMPVWLLLVGWLALSWAGLAYWYFPPFVKREVVAPRAALLPLALVHLALVAFAVAHLGFDAGARRAFLALAGVALAATALLLAVSAFRGRPWRGGVPSWRREGPYRRGDRLAAALAAAAVAHLAVAGALLAALPLRGLGGGHFVLLAAGFALQGLAAFAVFLLPRNVKRPLGSAGAAAGWTALAVGNVGAAVLSFALLRPFSGVPFAAGAAPLAAALLVLAPLLVVTPWRAPREHPGALLLGARPWLVASGAALALAALALPVVFGGAAPVARALPALGALVIAAAGLAQAGLAVLAWPVLLNATPAHRAWGLAGAALAVAGLASAAAAPVPAAVGVALLALAGAAHVAQVAPLRTPRRDCPPRMSEVAD